MKKINLVILLLLLISIFSCVESKEDNEKLIDGNVEIDYVKSNTTLTNAKIIEMDSCEYIQYHVYFYEAITHRGRCKYCAERLKKALNNLEK